MTVGDGYETESPTPEVAAALWLAGQLMAGGSGVGGGGGGGGAMEAVENDHTGLEVASPLLSLATILQKYVVPGTVTVGKKADCVKPA